MQNHGEVLYLISNLRAGLPRFDEISLLMSLALRSHFTHSRFTSYISSDDSQTIIKFPTAKSKKVSH